MAATAEETRRRAWTPRVPLTAAERRVDFVAHNEHIIQRRFAVERHALPAARRLALAVSNYGLPTNALERELEGALYVSLSRSVDFGYRQVRRELRGDRPTIRAAVRIPGIGQRGRVALSGLAGIHGLVQQRARLVAHDVADTAAAAAHTANTTPGITEVAKTIAVRDAVVKTLHNDVLQLVGEALNLGRCAAAMEVLQERGGGTVLAAAQSQIVPEFAMRSEQLDKNTCEPCDHLHGEIVQVGTSEFYDQMPPSGCLGAGRCRGVYVFGEGSEFRMPTGPEEPSPPESWPWKDGETRFSVEPEIAEGWEAWEQALSPAERLALEQYTGGSFRRINGALRGESKMNATRQAQIERIRRAIDKAPDYSEPVTVWRGIDDFARALRPGEDPLQAALEDARLRWEVGDVIRMDGFQSASFWTDPALDASASRTRPGVVFEIRTRSGAYLGGKLSLFKDEAELLLRDGARYRVVGVKAGRFEKGDYGETYERVIVQLEQL